MNTTRHISAIAIALCVWCATSHAWTMPCTSRTSDAFNAARLARRNLLDHRLIHQSLRRDFSLMQYARVNESPERWKVHIGPTVNVHTLDGVDACSTTGARASEWSKLEFGLVVGVDEFKWGLSLRYYLQLNANFLESYVDRPSTLDRSMPFNTKYGASAGQSKHALRLQLTPWFALTLGTIDRGGIDIYAAADGTTLTQIDTDTSDISNQFVRIEVPRLDLSFDLIFGPNTNSLETLFIDLKQLPLWRWPLTWSVQVGKLKEERQTFSALGIQATTNLLAQTQAIGSTYELALHGDLTMATEWQSPNLRYAMAHARLAYKQSLNQNERGEKTNGFSYQFWLDAEGSVYNSRWMKEQLTRTAPAWGGYGGVGVGLGLSFMSVNLTAGMGINRPQTLDTLVEAVNSTERNLQFQWRVGF